MRIMSEYGESIISYVDPKTRKTLRVCADPLNQPPCDYLQVRTPHVTFYR